MKTNLNKFIFQNSTVKLSGYTVQKNGIIRINNLSLIKRNRNKNKHHEKSL